MGAGTLITGVTLKSVGRLFEAGGRSYDRDYERKQQTQELQFQNQILGQQKANYKAEAGRREAQYNQQIGQTLSMRSLEATLNVFTGKELAKQQLSAYKDMLAGSAYNAGQAMQQSATSGFRNTGTNASLHAGYREDTDGTADGLTGSKDSDVARTYKAIQNRNAVKRARDEYRTTTSAALQQARMQYLDKTYRADQLQLQKENDLKSIAEQVSMIEKQIGHNNKRIEDINDVSNIVWTEILDWTGALLGVTGDIMTGGEGTYW